jgi:hypothetical protein
MAGKLDKLNELGELLKSGAISQDEFNNLKKEILESTDKLENENKPVKQKENKIENSNKEKVQLKSFRDINNKQIKAPEIQFLDFKNLTNDEIKLLKPFLRLKQIHAPEEMTNDEIDIGNKLFTVADINQMNSERGGFNYAWGSIISVLASGAALYFITISPCFIILGAGTGLIASIFIAITTLNKADGTKLDRTFSFIALGLSAIAIFVYFSWGSDLNSSSDSSSSNSVDCSNSTGAYEQGFASGETARMLGDYSSCSSYVEDYNYQTGRNILSASDCFCEGYNDGKNGEDSKY